VKPVLQTSTIGHSREGRPLLLRRLNPSGTRGGTLLIGGVHGNEQATFFLLDRFLDRALARGGDAPRRVALLARANPDAIARESRYNARGVDINRNFETAWTPESKEPSGAAPWSEPETRHLRDWLLASEPERIVTLHWALAEVDADGPQSTPLAQAMWEALDDTARLPYRLRTWGGEEGDFCPGSLGRWAGFGLRYADGTRPAIVTLELPYDPRLPRPAVLPEDHLETVRTAWAQRPLDYLAAAEPAVTRMLFAACQ